METKKRELKKVDYVILIGIPIALILMVIQFALNYNSGDVVYIIIVILMYLCVLRNLYKKKEVKKEDG